jgi:hypothetical protein
MLQETGKRSDKRTNPFSSNTTPPTENHCRLMCFPDSNITRFLEDVKGVFAISVSNF